MYVVQDYDQMGTNSERSEQGVYKTPHKSPTKSPSKRPVVNPDAPKQDDESATEEGGSNIWSEVRASRKFIEKMMNLMPEDGQEPRTTEQKAAIKILQEMVGSPEKMEKIQEEINKDKPNSKKKSRSIMKYLS